MIIFGIANIGRFLLSSLVTLIVFPIMVYYFVKNPSSFYAQFGIDPEIVNNLQTIPASEEHLISCAICTNDIVMDEDILILKCEGR